MKTKCDGKTHYIPTGERSATHAPCDCKPEHTPTHKHILVEGPLGFILCKCGFKATHGEIVSAVNCHGEFVSLLRDVATMLPVAAHLHPDDLNKLQRHVVEMLEKAEASI